MDSYASFFATFGIVMLVFVGIILISLWKIHEKAGKPGWTGIVPIYNVIVELEIVGKPWWWLLLMFIPYVGIIWSIWTVNLLVKSFGKSEGFTVGVILLPFIFLPILAFGDSQYQGPSGKSPQYTGPELPAI